MNTVEPVMLKELRGTDYKSLIKFRIRKILIISLRLLLKRLMINKAAKSLLSIKILSAEIRRLKELRPLFVKLIRKEFL